MKNVPVLGICARSSGMGKTTLLAKLIPVLAVYGVKVSVIKQACADFDLDRPGKDSFHLRQAGAAQVLLSSPERWALLTEQQFSNSDDRLMPLIRLLDASQIDLVLVEGFRHAPIPKIEVSRTICAQPLLAWHDSRVIAVACDAPISSPVPTLELNDIKAVADFVLKWMADSANSWADGMVYESA